jgi:hypothetical protein
MNDGAWHVRCFGRWPEWVPGLTEVRAGPLARSFAVWFHGVRRTATPGPARWAPGACRRPAPVGWRPVEGVGVGGSGGPDGILGGGGIGVVKGGGPAGHECRLQEQGEENPDGEDGRDPEIGAGRGVGEGVQCGVAQGAGQPTDGVGTSGVEELSAFGIRNCPSRRLMDMALPNFSDTRM